MSQLIFSFGNGRADGSLEMNEVLGSKGANLAEMTKLGVPVPPGFTISAEVCQDFFRNGHECLRTLQNSIKSALKRIEKETQKELKEKPWHIEGNENAEWVLLDYVDVVAHVFYRETREFYNLEGLWADATFEKIEYQI